MIRIADLADPVWTAATHSIDVQVSHIEKSIENFNVDMDPIYQRGHVWSDEQRRTFVGYWLQGGTVPPIWIWQPSEEQEDVGVRHELIDGKQRMTALLDWWHGRIPATIDGRDIWVHETDRQANHRLTIKWMFVRLANRVDVLRFYLRLNGGGTPHSPEELARVRALLDAETCEKGLQ